MSCLKLEAWLFDTWSHLLAIGAICLLELSDWRHLLQLRISNGSHEKYVKVAFYVTLGFFNLSQLTLHLEIFFMQSATIWHQVYLSAFTNSYRCHKNG